MNTFNDAIAKDYAKNLAELYYILDLEDDVELRPEEEEMVMVLQEEPVLTISSFADPDPLCIGCGRRPWQIEEYLPECTGYDQDPDTYVRENEGTFNVANGHFACTECYILMDMPSGPFGWVAP